MPRRFRHPVSRAVVTLAIAGVWAVAVPAAGQVDRGAHLVDAAATQDVETVRRLVADGVDANTRRADGATALIWAAHWNDDTMAALLLAAGADVDAADDHGVTPLERAAENDSSTMVGRLLAAGADPNVARTSGMTPLMTAARTGGVETMRRLIDAGADVNAVTTATRATALMWAVAEGHADAARLLVDAGADPRVSTSKGFTPLLFAAETGDIAMAELLVDAGVDLDEPGADGTHALPYAIAAGQDRFAQFLIDAGADPDGTMAGLTALHAAAGNVGTWLRDWSRTHGHGGTYLGGGFARVALPAERRLPLVRALLARGANPNARITTSAMLMIYIGYPTKGAFEPFACGTGDLRGATPLWVAAHAANISLGDSDASTAIIRALLDAGADLRLTTDDGTTPLMAAAGLGRSTFRPREPRGIRSPGAEAAVRLLHEAGADINARNEADFTALHGAAFRGLNEVVEYLVARGADIDARDFRGRTAYRMAEGAKQSFQFQSWPETAALLTRLGADTTLGIPGTAQERLRDVPVGTEP